MCNKSLLETKKFLKIKIEEANKRLLSYKDSFDILGEDYYPSYL